MTTTPNKDRQERIAANIISAFVNGWMSPSAAKNALKAIGIKDVDDRLQAVWTAK